MSEFLMQWAWYLLAFVAGSVVAWLITILTIHRTSREEAIAALPGGSDIEIGAR